MTALPARILRALLDNATLKLLSVGLSLLLFVFVRGDREEEAGISVPVVYEPDPDRVVVSDPVDRLRVKVRGRSSELRRAWTDDLEPVRILLTGVAQGEHFFTADSIRLPPGVRVMGIQPASTSMRFEPSVTREAEVVPVLVGSYDPAFVLTDKGVEPTHVRVRGPRPEVMALDRVPTVPIDVAGRWENSVVEVGLAPPGHHVEIDPPVERVRVRLVFEARIGEKDVDAVPVEIVGGGRYAVALRPGVARVRLEGPLKVLGALGPGDVEAFVDVADLDEKPPGTYAKPVQVANLPAGVELIRTRPRTLHVTTRPLPPEPAGRPDGAAPPRARREDGRRG